MSRTFYFVKEIKAHFLQIVNPEFWETSVSRDITERSSFKIALYHFMSMVKDQYQSVSHVLLNRWNDQWIIQICCYRDESNVDMNSFNSIVDIQETINHENKTIDFALPFNIKIEIYQNGYIKYFKYNFRTNSYMNYRTISSDSADISNWNIPSLANQNQNNVLSIEITPNWNQTISNIAELVFEHTDEIQEQYYIEIMDLLKKIRKP